MGFVVDHAVAISAIVLLVLVLTGLAILGIAALRLWRVVKAVNRRVSRAAADLAAEGDALSAALARLPDRQGELQGALADLRGRAALLGVLSKSATDALAVLRAPLRYLGM